MSDRTDNLSSDDGQTASAGTNSVGWVAGVIEFMTYLVRHWRLIGGLTFAGGIFGIVLALVLPETFQSRGTLILTEGQSSPTGALAKLAGGDLGSLLSMGTSSTANEVGVLLEADTLAVQSIDQFHLQRTWKMDTTRPIRREDLLRSWARSFTYAFGDKDQLVVSFEDEDPRLAEAVLEAHIRRIDSAWISLKKSEAIKKSAFAQERLDDRLVQLQSKVDSLIKFQIRNRIFDPAEQLHQTVLAISGMESKMSGVRVNRELQDRLSGGSSAAELGALNSILESQAARFVDAKDSTRGAANSRGLLMNLPKALPLAAEYERRARLIQLDVTVAEGLARQVEQLKIESMRDVSILQVVDPPVVPTKRKSPPRTALVELLTAMSFAFGCLLALLMEYFRASPADYALFKNLLRAWK